MYKKFCRSLGYYEESEKQSKGSSLGNDEPNTFSCQQDRIRMGAGFDLELYSSDRLLRAVNELGYCEQGYGKLACVRVRPHHLRKIVLGLSSSY